MKMKPEVRRIGSVAKKGTPVRKIATRNDLLEWLFETLDQLEPRIAVEDDIIGAKEEIPETLCEDERFDFPPLYWPDVFSFVRWTEQANPAAQRCGLDLLYFMFMLADAIQKSDGARVPQSRTIEMMLQCWSHSTSYLVFRSEGAYRWIKTTSLGVQTFGVSVCVEMPEIKSKWPDHLWDLDVYNE